MIKNAIKLLPFLLLIFLFNNDHEVFAHKSISDGNATNSNNFSPYEVSKDSWNKRWDNKGHRGASETSGKRLVYDIFTGQSSHKYKKKWEIQEKAFQGKEKQKYLVFWGWSALQGYHHHYRDNQATYILLYNPSTKEEKMYKAEMTNLDASEDMEYGRALSDDKTIYNPCGESTFNKKSDSCNMYYKYVGFKAWIPLNEIFPENKNTTWRLYIVKNVEGHVVHDELRLPFEFEKLKYAMGEISLISEIDTDKLVMNTEGVIRRSQPRANNPDDVGKYFTKEKKYTKIDHDEREGTAIWYGVRSPEDGNKKRWTSSPFWTFSGSQAVLKYQVSHKTCPDGTVVTLDKDCTVNVTIYHKDYDTGKTLRTDTQKATVGKNYSFSPVSKGTFKDSKGNPYVSYPSNQTATGTTPNRNFTVTFNYRVSLPDPSNIRQLEGSTSGKAKGEFFWILNKSDSTSGSRIIVSNNVSIDGKHYATRNTIYKISSPNVFSVEDNSNQTYYLNNPNDLKNKKILYSFSYEYTNHYRENYKCVEKQGNDCFKWEFENYTPVWDSGYLKNASWSKELNVDHKYGETFKFGSTSNSDLSLIIGRKATINGYESSSINEQTLKENFVVDKAPTILLAQTWLPISEKIEYTSDLNNGLYVIPQHMYYFPYDIDDNLKLKYKNQTPFEYSNYAIPLKIGTKNQNSVIFNLADNFFVTRNTGFVFSVPSTITNMNEINNRVKTEYELYTNSIYDDTILNSISEGSRYFLNIKGNGSQQNNKWYTNVFVLGKMGLSDVTFHVDELYLFEKYLLGNPLDDPLINEQQETILNVEYPHSITIDSNTLEKIKKIVSERNHMLLHDFRSIDIKEIYDQLKRILPSI